ncbi:MAG: A24 family peptidase [Nanoarchaeota archaeon]
MITGIILVIVALLVLLIATYTDFKTGEIPDWLSYSFIISALGIRLLHSILYNDRLYMLYGIIGFAAMAVFSMLIYYTRQWGGGDAKIAMGLGAAFATSPLVYTSDVPYLLSLVSNIFIAGGIYGMLWGVYVFARNFKKTLRVAKEEVIARKWAYIIIIALPGMTMIISLFMTGINAVMAFYFSLLILAYLLLFVFIKASEKSGMYARVLVSKLIEGDWVAEDIRIKGKPVYSKKSLGITKEQIALLRKAKIKTVIVKTGIKFLIAILIGTAATIAYGNIIVFALF